MGLQAIKIVKEEFEKCRASWQVMDWHKATLADLEARVKERIMKECVEVEESK